MRLINGNLVKGIIYNQIGKCRESVIRNYRQHGAIKNVFCCRLSASFSVRSRRRFAIFLLLFARFPTVRLSNDEGEKNVFFYCLRWLGPGDSSSSYNNGHRLLKN